jgi:titin
MNTVELHWTDNSLVEDGYEVQRWDEVLGGWSIVADLPANASSYRDEGLTADVWYWYLVRAKKDGGYSYFSNYATVFTASAPPDAPSGVAVSIYFGSSAYVSWIDNSSNEEGFRVQRGPDETGPWETVATTAADESYFYEELYPAGQKHCYQIIAFNGRGESSPSADCATPPPAVTDLAATTVDHQAIDLSWTYNSTAADGFVLYRYGYPYGEFYGSVDLAATETSYRDEGLASNTSYWYFIVAINEDGYSDYSNGVIASTDVLPGADQTSTAKASRPGSARAVPNPRTLAKELAGRAQAPSADRPSRRKPMCPSTVPLRHDCPRSAR